MSKKRAAVAAPRTPPRANSKLHDALFCAALFCATLLAYFPALNGSPLWDDSSHITRPELRSLHGLWRIWTDLGVTQQYYPLLHTAFWVEYRLWGDAVAGYHLTNIALHSIAACLVMLILKRLSIPGARLAAFLFALHPVCVEAVAWISEQKSTLSAAFYLASALAYIHFDQARRRSQYVFALVLFVLALLTKTVTATLPAALLLILWWKRGRIEFKSDAMPLLPWFAIGASAGAFTAWVEWKFIGAHGAEYDLTILDRVLLAGRVIWFYIFKLVWPVNLIFTYPHWTIDPHAVIQYLFPLAAVGVAIALWIIARRNRTPLAGYLYFCGTLFPVLGFLNVYPFRYSYVADHFQYLASLGLLVPVAGALAILLRRNRRALAAPILLVVILGALSWRQSRIYTDDETLYRETLARNPESWMAHHNLAKAVAESPGGLPEAIEHYEAALRINPDFAEGHNNLGNALAQIPGRQDDAVRELETAVRLDPGYANAHYNLGLLLSKTGHLPEAIAQFRAALRANPNLAEAHNNLAIALSQTATGFPEAIAEYHAALRLNPDFAAARENLANVLVQSGRLDEAIAEYQAALQLEPANAEAHNNLGYALAQAGRTNDAIAEFETALRINPAYAAARANLESITTAPSSSPRIPNAAHPDR